MFLLLPTLNLIFAVGGLALFAVSAVLFVDYLVNRSALYTRFIHPFVWPLIIVTTSGSVAVSLLYSEYFGFIPCSLCWLQRIALYPQALLSIIGYRLRDTSHFPLYGIALSLFGFAVALYQYAYQMLPKNLSGSVMPCLADGSADCATKVIDLFGFVTFPLLSAITFAFLIVLYLNLRRAQRAT